MEDRKEQFIIKAKCMLCPGIGSQDPVFLSVKDGINQAISDDMPESSSDEIVDLSTYTVSPCFSDYHLHFSEQAKAAAESNCKKGVTL